MDVSKITTVNVSARKILELVEQDIGEDIPAHVKYDFSELSSRHSDVDAIALKLEFTTT